MKIDKEKEIEEMLQEAKRFVSMFDEIVSNISEGEIINYQNKLKKFIKS